MAACRAGLSRSFSPLIAASILLARWQKNSFASVGMGAYQGAAAVQKQGASDRDVKPNVGSRRAVSMLLLACGIALTACQPMQGGEIRLT